VLLFKRYLPPENVSGWSTVFFWGANVMVLVAGWLVISSGMLKLTAR
jgi:hypothetical protein